MLLQAQQGEVAMEANLTEPGYSLELSSPVPIGYVSGHLLHCLFGFATAVVSITGKLFSCLVGSFL